MIIVVKKHRKLWKLTRSGTVKTNGALLASILLLFKCLGLLLTVCAVILFNYLAFEKIACPNRGVGLFNSRRSASSLM